MYFIIEFNSKNVKKKDKNGKRKTAGKIGQNDERSGVPGMRGKCKKAEGDTLPARCCKMFCFDRIGRGGTEWINQGYERGAAFCGGAAGSFINI